jgi:hypothetical protein
MTRSGRHSTRAACLSARPEVHRASIPTPPRAAGSISRTKRFPRRRRRGRGDHPPSPRRWTSPRDEPARAKARDRAPAAPRAAPRAAAHGSWVAQCPAPFLSYTKFHVRLGVVRREGGHPSLISWLSSGQWVRSSSWALVWQFGESFVYLLYSTPIRQIRTARASWED